MSFQVRRYLRLCPRLQGLLKEALEVYQSLLNSNWLLLFITMDSALIGCGFIGGLIAEHVASGRLPIRLRLLLDRHEDKVKRIQDLFKEPPGAAHAIEDIISSNADLVVEAASIGAVQSFAKPLLSSGKDMMIMSVGAFSDTRFYKRVEELCMEKDVRVYLPSGAIGALD